jgi:hypothetical protein
MLMLAQTLIVMAVVVLSMSAVALLALRTAPSPATLQLARSAIMSTSMNVH